MSKKRIKIPDSHVITYVNEDGSPVLDENEKPRKNEFSILTFVRNEMGRCKGFMETGPLGLAAYVRVEDAVLAAIDAKADSFDLYDVDHELLREHIESPPDGKLFGQDIIGPRAMLRFVNAWLEATDVQEAQETNQEAAE